MDAYEGNMGLSDFFSNLYEKEDDMAINLQKGQRVDLGLRNVCVGLGWDPNETRTGYDYDLDASAFLLNKSNKLPTERFLVFYNNLSSPDNAVRSSGDDQTGGSSEGDDETLMVDLSKVDPSVETILFVVTIHDAEARKQNFGQVRNSYMRIYDADKDEEICKYELDEDFSIETALEFGRMYRKDGQWRFEAVGTGYKGGMQGLVDKYS